MRYAIGDRLVLRRILTSLVFTLATTSLLSCENGKGNSRQAVRHFPLTIALAEPLEPAGGSLPDEIKTMCRPVEAKTCPGTLFIPEVRVLRLDLQDAQAMDLHFGKEQNAIQKALGKQLTPEKARLAREKGIGDQQITPLLAQPKGPWANTVRNTSRLLASARGGHVLATKEARRILEAGSGESDVQVVNDIDELISQMAEHLCDKRNQKSEATSFVVLFSGEDAVDQADAPTAPSKPTETTSTRSSSLQAQADATLNKLLGEVQAAKEGRISKAQVHEHLAAAQNTNSWDYRFTYERATLSVYGTKEHDEAFHHLYRAAEIAIENSKAEKMIEQLKGDAREDGPLHRLSHGHKDWTTLIHALETKDSHLVRK